VIALLLPRRASKYNFCLSSVVHFDFSKYLHNIDAWISASVGLAGREGPGRLEGFDRPVGSGIGLIISFLSS
jgi:hypothetical protein